MSRRRVTYGRCDCGGDRAPYRCHACRTQGLCEDCALPSQSCHHDEDGDWGPAPTCERCWAAEQARIDADEAENVQEAAL